LRLLSTQKVIQHQADATLNQANPVSGTQYTVLAVSGNVRVYQGQTNVTWTVQPTPLELHHTIDGNIVTFTVANPVSTTIYGAFEFNAGLASNAQALLAHGVDRMQAFLVEGRTVLIRAETTGGTTSNLSARVIWGRW